MLVETLHSPIDHTPNIEHGKNCCCLILNKRSSCMIFLIAQYRCFFGLSLSGCPLASKLALQNAETGSYRLKMFTSCFFGGFRDHLNGGWFPDLESLLHLSAVSAHKRDPRTRTRASTSFFAWLYSACVVVRDVSRRRETRFGPLVGNEDFGKSCLHQSEIYKCEFFSSSSSNVIEKSSS